MTEISWDINKTINLGENLGSIQAQFLTGDGISLNKCPKSLAIKYRKGGEEIKPSGHKITKSLKNLFQENNVLPWVRDKIPLIYVDQELISVGDLWINQDYKANNNDLLLEYFDKYQSFCLDLHPDNVLKGELNFNYK